MYFARYPDGSRREINFTLDHGYRRRSGGPQRWVYGDIEIQPSDVFFKDGDQPVYTPPPLSAVPDLEAELARDEEFLSDLKEDKFAQAFYKIFSNREFFKNDDDRRWSCGERQAARLLSNLRGLGESYQDFFLIDDFEGTWPDDRSGRKEELVKNIAQFSQSIPDPVFKLQVPSRVAIDGVVEEIETQPQAEAVIERWTREFEKRRPELEKNRQEMLETLHRQLADLERSPNADVFASLRAHLDRLGWRTETEADRVRASSQVMQRGLTVLREVRELEARLASPREPWAEVIAERRARRQGHLEVVASHALEKLSPDERDVQTGRVARRLDDLALTGRIGERDYVSLSERLNQR